MSEDLFKLKKRAKDLIKKGKIEDAIQELEFLVQANQKASNRLILLGSRYSNLKLQERDGTGNSDVISRRKNEITVGLLDFIDEVSEEDFIIFMEQSSIVTSLKNELEERNELLEQRDQEIKDLIIDLQNQKEQLQLVISEFEELKKRNSQFIDAMIINASTKDLIERGEGEQIEFKLNIRGSMIHNIVKTLVAFMNTKGGVLIIGVDDSSEVLGVPSLTAKKFDQFQRHLLSMVKDLVGPTFCNLISIDTEELEGKIIIRINCEVASSPAYYAGKREAVSYKEEFLMRLGGINYRFNSIREIMSYIRKRY